MSYIVRTATARDIPRVLEIYARARQFMAQTGNPSQWGKTHPPKETLETDIENGDLYAVCREDAVCGVFFFSTEPDPTYEVIEGGSWLSDAPYGTIHRIASDGSGGIFGACLTWCLGRCRHLRIDTHEDNHVMQHVLQKHGFSRRGIIYVADGTPRIAYERV